MANDGLPELLSLLEVERVVVIDDQFTPGSGMVTANFERDSMPEIEGFHIPDGEDFETYVNDNWDALPIDAKVKVKDKVRKAGGEDYIGDPIRLERLLNGSIEYLGLTLFEWERAKKRLFKDKTRSLILFDVDFKDEIKDDGDEAGLSPAGEALREASTHIVGLITGEVRQDDWPRKAEISVAQLVVVNKALVASEDDDELDQAIEQIRTTLQASRLTNLRERVLSTLKKELDVVDRSLSGNEARVLEDVVFRTSNAGGEWEGDTWFRFYETLGSKQAHQKLARDPKVRSSIVDVRRLTANRRDDGHLPESEELLRNLEEQEAYVSKSALNQAGLPIENGDIFKAKGSRYFVLVGQPCDLAIRKEGKRSRSSETATLLEIKKRKESEDDSNHSAFELPPGCPGGNSEREVRLKPEFHVSLDILDLVSFNLEGMATLAPKSEVQLTPYLPGLGSRLDAIAKNVKPTMTRIGFIEKLEKAEELTKNEANSYKDGFLGGRGPFEPTFGAIPAPFAFHCTRVGRLSGSYADALLVAHASARSRTAHAYRLTRIVSEDSNAE